jgi:hypothetical protein
MATITVGTGKDYASIHTALSNARTGSDNDFDIIEVYNGTYVESVTSSVVEYIRITAAPGNSPVLDGESAQTSAFSMAGTDGEWTIDGFEIKNYDVVDANAAIQGASPNGSHINVRDCVIQQNGKEEYKRRAESSTAQEVDQVPVVLFSRGVWKYRAKKEAYLATRGRKQEPTDITGS